VNGSVRTRQTPGEGNDLFRAPVFRPGGRGCSLLHRDVHPEKGWKIGNDRIGGFEVKGVQITNTSKAAHTVFFAMKVLKGSNMLAAIDCSTSAA
jgi:hypothetical protein